LLYGAFVVAALVSALGQQTIAALWGDGWGWVDFGQDFFASGVIAVILAVVARALQREQDRAEAERAEAAQAVEDEASRVELERTERGRLFGYEALPLAVRGWSKIPVPDADPAPPPTAEDLDALAGSARQFRELADEIDQLQDSRPSDDTPSDEVDGIALQVFLTLQLLSNRLQIYLAEGGRRRRLIYLQWLSGDLATAAAAGLPWSNAVYRFRNTAVVLQGWVQHTDTTIVERLLVERVTHLFYPPPPENVWRRPRTADDLEDPAAIADPLYLLLFHINQACDQISPNEEPRQALALLDHVARCLGALRNELRAAANCSDALVQVARAATDVMAGRSAEADAVAGRQRGG